MRQILWQRYTTIQRLKTLLGKKEVIDGLILDKFYMIRPYHALCTAQNWKSHRANLMDIDSICGPTKINHHFNPHKSNFLKLTFLTLALRKSHFSEQIPPAWNHPHLITINLVLALSKVWMWFLLLHENLKLWFTACSLTTKQLKSYRDENSFVHLAYGMARAPTRSTLPLILTFYSLLGGNGFLSGLRQTVNSTAQLMFISPCGAGDMS